MKLNTLSTHTLITTFGLLFGCSSGIFGQNCDINASVTPETIFCGQEAVLTAFGSGDGDVIMDEDFNTDGGSFGPGWSTTPGAVMWNNPCSPGGVDNTPHAWMGNTTSVPRDIITTNYDISGATAGVTICFDLLFSTAQVEPSFIGKYTAIESPQTETVIISSDKIEVLTDSKVVKKFFFYEKETAKLIFERVNPEVTSIDLSISKDRRLYTIKFNQLHPGKIRLDITHPNGKEQELTLIKVE